MMKSTDILRLVLLIPLVVAMLASRLTGQIIGRVLDHKTGNPLAGVGITVRGTSLGATTGEDGCFSIHKVAPGIYCVAASRTGYNQEKIDSIVVTARDTVHVIFELHEKVFLLREIVVTPGHFSLAEGETRSSSGLEQMDLRNFPQFGEDVYRAASRLPGLASTDFSANFYVRGGEQDEVLILLDGMELLYPFHLEAFGGSISTIDVEAIREIDMMTGAFPAEYGNRLSGVFNITSRTPSSEKTKTSLALSTMYGRLLSEGSLDGGKFRWQLLARKGFVDFILNLIGEGESKKPRYYDVLGKVQYFLNADHEISAHVLVSHDKLIGTESDLIYPQEEFLDYTYGTVNAWLTWNAQLGSRLSAQTTSFVGSAFNNKLSHAVNGDILEYEASDNHSYTLSGLKQNLSFELTDWYLLKCGFDLKAYGAGYDYHYTGTNRDQSGASIRREQTIHPRGTELGIYAANRFRVSPTLTVELGMRYQQATWTGDKDWNPRINVAQQLGERTTIRAGWGMFSQTHAIDKLNMADDDYTFYPAESSTHIMAGLEHEFENGINLRIEGYHKSLSDIRPRYIGYRFNTDTSPENSHDRLRLEPDEGRSAGLEIYLHKSNLSQFKWWLNYSYSAAENRVKGRIVPREMDQRHTINADLSYQPDEHWAFSVSWNYHSGWPYTEETVNVIERHPNGSYHWEWEPGPLYGKRFPAYHRMDVRASRNFETSYGRISLFVEVRNVYDRRNVRGYDYTEVFILSLDRYQYKKEPREWLPRIPSFGASWEF